MLAKALSLAAVAFLATPAEGLAWTRSYLVTLFEQANHYGGPPKGAQDDPGPDCPEGVNRFDTEKQLVTAWRTPEQAKQEVSPETSRERRNFTTGFRGPYRELVYENPTQIADPGLIQVAWDKSEGFNLDGNAETGFPVGVAANDQPTGEKGVDNAFYKVTGCIQRYRMWSSEQLPRHPITILIVISGSAGDALNEPDAQVGIYASNQEIVRDASGNPTSDYTYLVTEDAAYQHVFKAKITNGVVESVGPVTMQVGDYMGQENRVPVVLHQGRARFTMAPDGTLEGIVGGYRDWALYYRNIVSEGHPFYAGAAEQLGNFNAIGLYYALRRAADGLPDAEGRMTGISTAYRFRGVPTYVVDPKGEYLVQVAKVFSE